MKPTIKNKLIAGFGSVLILMGIMAAIATYAVLNLRRSALETARVGDRLGLHFSGNSGAQSGSAKKHPQLPG